MEYISSDIHGTAKRRRNSLLPAGLATAGAAVLISLFVAACGTGGKADTSGPASPQYFLYSGPAQRAGRQPGPLR
jgi:hypothetical protein